MADAEEHRAQAVEGDQTTQSRHFVYRPDGLIQGEYSDTGEPIREYLYLGSRPIAVITPSVISAQSYDRFYIHSNHLGTPKVITDQTQNMVWKATHTPFGKATVLVEGIENHIRFLGQYYDEETGLHYNWHRYYDPSTGRYITSDPIGLNGGLNTYGYANQNPVNYIDPNGLVGVVGTGVSTGTGLGLGLGLGGSGGSNYGQSFPAGYDSNGVFTGEGGVIIPPEDLPDRLIPEGSYTEVSSEFCPPGGPPEDQRERCINGAKLQLVQCIQFTGTNNAICYTRFAIQLLGCSLKSPDEGGD